MSKRATGYMKGGRSDLFMCSECGMYFDWNWTLYPQDMNYCPKCGVKLVVPWISFTEEDDDGKECWGGFFCGACGYRDIEKHDTCPGCGCKMNVEMEIYSD